MAETGGREEGKETREKKRVLSREGGEKPPLQREETDVAHWKLVNYKGQRGNPVIG